MGDSGKENNINKEMVDTNNKEKGDKEREISREYHKYRLFTSSSNFICVIIVIILLSIFFYVYTTQKIEGPERIITVWNDCGEVVFSYSGQFAVTSPYLNQKIYIRFFDNEGNENTFTFSTQGGYTYEIINITSTPTDASNE